MKRTRKGKYNAQGLHTSDGYFDSKGEYSRWCELKWLIQAGQIQELKRQVKLQLSKSVTWRIDFVYQEHGTTVYEDFKGMKLADYKIKKRLLCDLIDSGEVKGIFRESTRDGITDYGGLLK